MMRNTLPPLASKDLLGRQNQPKDFRKNYMSAKTPTGTLPWPARVRSSDFVRPLSHSLDQY